MTWILLFLYLIGAFVGLLFLIAGFPIITGGASTANASITTFTSNVSAWEGFSASFIAMPLILYGLYGSFVLFGAWQILKRLKGNQ